MLGFPSVQNRSQNHRSMLLVPILIFICVVICLFYVFFLSFFLNANVLLLLLFFFSGALGVFYGNKTSSQFVSFSSMVHLPGDLNTHILSVKGAHVVVEFKQNIHSNGNRKRQKMS